MLENLITLATLVSNASKLKRLGKNFLNVGKSVGNTMQGQKKQNFKVAKSQNKQPQTASEWHELHDRPKKTILGRTNAKLSKSNVLNNFPVANPLGKVDVNKSIKQFSRSKNQKPKNVYNYENKIKNIMGVN